MKRLLACAVALLLVGCGVKGAPDRIKGRPEWGELKLLHSDDLIVEVAPRIGRIMHLSEHVGTNLLWTDRSVPIMTFGPFVNYGGDKVWAWPQDAWGWPPPKAIDVGPFEVLRSTDDEMTLRGPVDPKTGLQTRRQIVVKDKTVRQTYVLERAEIVPGKPVAAWSVTQVAPPDELYVRLIKGQKPDAKLMQEGKATATPLNDRWVRVTPAYDNSKLGFAGDAILGIWGDEALLIEKLPDPQDAQLETPVAAQLYFRELPKNSAVPDATTYVELEFIGPTLKLEKGQRAALSTVWHVLDKAEAKTLIAKK